jgi:hypothetical protein
LKEQATKWEVDVARLNADLASKFSNPLIFNLPDITYPTYRHFFGITIMPIYLHVSDTFFSLF